SGQPPAHWLERVRRDAPELLEPGRVPMVNVRSRRQVPSLPKPRPVTRRPKVARPSAARPRTRAPKAANSTGVERPVRLRSAPTDPTRVATRRAIVNGLAVPA